MWKYIIKRILLIVPTIMFVIMIVFSIMSLTPSSPGRLILGQTANEAAVAALNERLGYNRPFLIRFGNYVAGIMRGDFGSSYRTGRPVFEDVFSRFPVTLALSLMAITVTVAVGLPVGVYSAIRQYSALDYTFTITAMFFSSFPVFWFGLMLIILFSLKLGWLPSNGADTWRHFILPVGTLSLPYLAIILRMTRSTMLETIRQDYIRTARAKGVPERRVIMRHALKNALLPIITLVGMIFGLLLGGAVLTETVFSIPGLGTLIVNAIRMKDIPQVMAAVIFLSTMFCGIMLLVDILYALVDPRVKAMYRRSGNH